MKLVCGGIDCIIIMCAARFGDRYEYHWCDGVNYKKPTALPAPQYIALLMEWVESQINDESLFPVQIGQCCHRFIVVGFGCFFYEVNQKMGLLVILGDLPPPSHHHSSTSSPFHLKQYPFTISLIH